MERYLTFKRLMPPGNDVAEAIGHSSSSSSPRREYTPSGVQQQVGGSHSHTLAASFSGVGSGPMLEKLQAEEAAAPKVGSSQEYTSPTDQSQSLSRNIPHTPTNRSPSLGIYLTHRPIAVSH
eukprot:227758-Pyramimonas_sp.AAC.1